MTEWLHIIPSPCVQPSSLLSLPWRGAHHTPAPSVCAQRASSRWLERHHGIGTQSRWAGARPTGRGSGTQSQRLQPWRVSQTVAAMTWQPAGTGCALNPEGTSMDEVRGLTRGPKGQPGSCDTLPTADLPPIRLGAPCITHNRAPQLEARPGNPPPWGWSLNYSDVPLPPPPRAQDRLDLCSQLWNLDPFAHKLALVPRSLFVPGNPEMLLTVGPGSPAKIPGCSEWARRYRGLHTHPPGTQPAPSTGRHMALLAGRRLVQGPAGSPTVPSSASSPSSLFSEPVFMKQLLFSTKEREFGSF